MTEERTSRKPDTEKLLQSDEEAKGNSAFSIPMQKFIEMFDQDNHATGVGLNKYKELGGKEGVLQGLKVTEERGLDDQDANLIEARKETYGTNAAKPVEIKTLCELICDQFEDKTIRILIVACVCSLGIGIWEDLSSTENDLQFHFLEGVSILFAILLCVIVGSWNNYNKEKQFQKLMATREERDITVFRNGVNQNISVHELLVGDLLVFTAGEQLPADCILLSGTKVMADESSQTGESRDIEKHPLGQSDPGAVNPFLLSGTMIKDGKGVALVVCVGANTRMGRIREMMEQEDEMTPLQRKLERIANGIGKMGLAIAIITAIGMGIWFGTKFWTVTDGSWTWSNAHVVSELLNIFIFAITIVVMAVPEGLPLAVTLSLAYAVGKMKDENNLVRQLDSCETMGGSNNICSDKTGTLTQNVMTVMGIYVEGRGKDNSRNAAQAQLSPETKEILCHGICVNSQAFLLEDPRTHERKRIGNATECALLSMAESMGYNYDKYRVKEMEVLTIPFNSTRKRMTSVYKIAGKPAVYRVYVKGAPDLLLPSCTRIIGEGGQLLELDESSKAGIKQRVLKHNAEIGYRSLLLAYKEVNAEGFNPKQYESEEQFAILESELIVIAIIGIEDPLREGVKESVEICQRAGITVRMVTGDDIEYAKSIALQCGILKPEEIDPTSPEYKEYACMLGIELFKKVGGLVKSADPEKPETTVDKVANPEMFNAITRDLKVLARSQPEHKYLLVTGLKEDPKNVIAVTGDGTNDAPALKKADIGFAMGIAGTEIAKEAAKIILLDDNFSSIVTALKWGRNIYLSIRRFLQFQLTVNVSALVVSVVCGLLSGVRGTADPPINALQMLWVNLIMDTFAALALATEPPHDKLLLERPYSKNESILNRAMWRNVIFVAVYEIAVLLVFCFLDDSIWFFYDTSKTDYDRQKTNRSGELKGEGWNRLKNTMVFHIFVLMQLFNEISSRRFKSSEFNIFENFFDNWKFIIIWIITAVVQYALISFPNKGVKTLDLTLQQHLVCLGFGAFILAWGLLCKLVIPESLFKILAVDEREMTDQEYGRGFLTSFLRRQRKIKPANPELIKKKGLKSFAFPKRSIIQKASKDNARTFNRALVRSLMKKK